MEYLPRWKKLNTEKKQILQDLFGLRFWKIPGTGGDRRLYQTEIPDIIRRAQKHSMPAF